jgi:GNAT superfamily N-acetyltransferase
MELAIRDIRSSDERAWRPLWDGYLRFYETELASAATDATWRRLLDPSIAMSGIVAERGDALVGFAHCVFHPYTWGEADACYLEDLFVDPEARGSGAGRRLVDTVIERARAAGCGRVYWHTHRDNRTARALYDSFTPADDFVRYVVPLDR